MALAFVMLFGFFVCLFDFFLSFFFFVEGSFFGEPFKSALYPTPCLCVENVFVAILTAALTSISSCASLLQWTFISCPREAPNILVLLTCRLPSAKWWLFSPCHCRVQQVIFKVAVFVRIKEE